MNSKIKYKHIIAHIVQMACLLLPVFSVYLFYRIFVYREWQLILLMTIVTVLQSKAKGIEFLKQWTKTYRMKDYFQDHQIIELENTKKTNSMFAFHPHGVLTQAVLMNAHTKGTFYETMIPLASRAALEFPLAGLYHKLTGLESVSSSNMSRHLKNGQNIGLVPGGFEEASLTVTHENRLFLRNRKGFIKYALKYGTTIYPVFTFGENQLYYTWDILTNFRLWLNKFKIGCVIFWSKYLLLGNPDISLITICAKGFHCPQISKPSNSDVNKYHALYLNHLEQFYDKYAPKYAPGIKLKIY